MRSAAMEWHESDLVPGMLVRTRQLVLSARWWCVTIWNGLEDDYSREWEFLETCKTECEAISKAAFSLRELAR
jgi:hypothetical protein